jgi:cytosine/uracil/thiamine/allantoin permease
MGKIPYWAIDMYRNLLFLRTISGPILSYMVKHQKLHFMKKLIPFALMSSLLVLVSSCAAIEGIFKAGVWSGILLVVVVVALIIWIISKLFGGSK